MDKRFFLIFAAALGAVSCAQPAKFPTESEVECIAAALKPALQDGYDAAALAKRVADKTAPVDEVLDAIKGDVAAVKATVKAVEACGKAQ